MCGRAEVHHSAEEIRRHLHLDDEPGPKAEIQTSYNLAPTDPLPVVRRPDVVSAHGEVTVMTQAAKLQTMRWGLTLDNPKAGGFNARIESLSWSGYRENVRERRCLVVLSSFYEWKKVGDKKLPYRIVRDDGAPLLIAAFYDEAGGCCLITKPSSGVVAEIHDRMPAILEREQWSAWLDPSVQDVMPILNAAGANDLTSYPVSKAVNAVRNNDVRMIERADERLDAPEPRPGKKLKKQLGLF